MRSVEAVGDAALIGEVYLPAAQLREYLQTLDAAFAFEVLHAGGDAEALTRHIASALAAGKPGWVLSNHDFSRLGSRTGAENLRAATLLLLSLPGPAFMFQGDEIGMVDGPTAAPELDRHGRDAIRRPMPWDSAAPNGGFTTGTPWLPVGDGTTASVAEQERDRHSQLALVRRLIELRRTLGPQRVELLDAAPETLVLARGDHTIAVNLGSDPRPAPQPRQPRAHATDELVLEARPGDGADLQVIPPHGGWIARYNG
jgi:alpha-glucosidase